jgi:hypothetical protein
VGGTLDAMFDFAREHDALAICHHTSRSVRGRDFAQSYFGGQDIEPVMEVYSQWGSSEEEASSRPRTGRHPGEGHYYRYALKHGFRLGVIGGSDSHCTTPGGPVPMAYPKWGGKPLFPHPGGIAAVFASELTRPALFEALRARRCCAASLDKILVWTERSSTASASSARTRASTPSGRRSASPGATRISAERVATTCAPPSSTATWPGPARSGSAPREQGP